jgi:hypothetical protein
MCCRKIFEGVLAEKLAKVTSFFETAGENVPSKQNEKSDSNCEKLRSAGWR